MRNRFRSMTTTRRALKVAMLAAAVIVTFDCSGDAGKIRSQEYCPVPSYHGGRGS